VLFGQIPARAKKGHVPEPYFILFTASIIWLSWAYLAKKCAIAATMPIVTAFKFGIRHRKNGLLNLNRLPIEVRFWCF
jgi:hypothetical protein